LVISIPAHWVKKYGLKKGEELEINEEGKILRIATNRTTASRKIDIDLSNTDILTNRIIKAVYQHGYDSANFKFDDLKHLEKIRKVSDELIGFESIEQGKNYCILKNLSGHQKEDFKILFRRLFLLTKILAKDFAEAVESNDTDALKAILTREIDINKLANFCLRKLNKGEVDDFISGSKYYLTVYCLEHACDVYKETIPFLMNHKIKINNNIKQLFKDFSNFIELLYETTFSKDLGKAISAGKIFEKLKQQAQSEMFASLNEFQIQLKLKSLLRLTIPILESQLLDFTEIIKTS
jgi:phosphate uptake regulator